MTKTTDTSSGGAAQPGDGDAEADGAATASDPAIPDSGDGTVTGATEATTVGPSPTATPVLEARGLVKTWGT